MLSKANPRVPAVRGPACQNVNTEPFSFSELSIFLWPAGNDDPNRRKYGSRMEEATLHTARYGSVENVSHCTCLVFICVSYLRNLFTRLSIGALNSYVRSSENAQIMWEVNTCSVKMPVNIPVNRPVGSVERTESNHWNYGGMGPDCSKSQFLSLRTVKGHSSFCPSKYCSRHGGSSLLQGYISVSFWEWCHWLNIPRRWTTVFCFMFVYF